MPVDLPKIVGVTAKTEVTRLLDPVPTPAANAIRLANIPRLGGGFLEPNLRESNIVGHLGPGPRGIAGGRYVTIEIAVELRGRGAVYAALPAGVDYAPLLLACGLNIQQVGGAGVEKHEYVPADITQPCTIYLYSYRKLFKMVGCVGNLRISGRAAGMPIATFTMTGLMRADNGVDLDLPAMTLTTVKGPVLGNATASIATVNFAGGLRLIAFDFDMGNQIAALPAAGAEDGHDGYELAGRSGSMSLTFRSIPFATYDALINARIATFLVTIDWGVAATPIYNSISLACNWEPQWPEFTDENGIGTLTVPGRLVIADGGTGEFTLTTK